MCLKYQKIIIKIQKSSFQQQKRAKYLSVIFKIIYYDSVNYGRLAMIISIIVPSPQNVKKIEIVLTFVWIKAYIPIK
jgi:hypothetical protein